MHEELSQGGRPVAFYSKKLTPTESHYHVANRDLMAVYLACMKWRHYLHGNGVSVTGVSVMCILTMNHLHTYLSSHISMLAKLAGWSD